MLFVYKVREYAKFKGKELTAKEAVELGDFGRVNESFRVLLDSD